MLKHKGTVTLETDRLCLRQAEIKDAPAMYRNWASSQEVTRFLTWPAHESVDVTRNIIAGWVDNYEKAAYYQWMIVLKELGEPIGSVMAVGNDKTDAFHIGYCIGAPWWHRGIMTEALGTVIEFLFREVGCNRVEARHDPNNPHSGRVMEKCGMQYEGTLRQADHNNQGICDACYYGLLAKDRVC